MNKNILGCLYGLIVGDMLWTPYEFVSREDIAKHEIILKSGGWWNVPLGAWSDDSSLMLCLADSLCNGYNLVDMSRKMIAWKNSEIWVATGKRFDIGNQTSASLDMLDEILRSRDYDCLKYLRNEASEYSNGNGALMKILPLYWYINKKNLLEQFEIIWEVSALTHPHIISAICCFLYLRMVHYIVMGENKFLAYQKTLSDFETLKNENPIFLECDVSSFSRIFSGKIFEEDFNELRGSGFVVETLEVVLWSFLKTENYKDAIITCIQFGDDTDTTAAICGGLAGIYYGFDNISVFWRESVLKKDEIFDLLEKFSKKYS